MVRNVNCSDCNMVCRSDECSARHKKPKGIPKKSQLKPLNHYVRSFGILLNATVKSTEIKDRLRPTPVENMSAITVISM